MMHSASDVIVLTSPPVRNAIYTPPPSAGDAEESLQNNFLGLYSSPGPVPSDLSRLPTRSRFFVTPDRNRSKTKIRTKDNTNEGKQMTADLNAAVSDHKPKRRSRKLAAGPQASSRDSDRTALEHEETAPLKPKRTRKKRADGGYGAGKSENKILTGRIAKAGTTESKEHAAKPADGQPTSRPTHGQCVRKENKLDHGADDLQLEPAMKRRLDWTPTKEPKPVIELGDSDDAGSGKNLSAFLSEYEYSGSNTASEGLQVRADDGPTKRRRIELMESGFLPAQPKPLIQGVNQNSEEDLSISTTSKAKKKPKTRAKRFTTITARATAPYLGENPEDLDFTEKDDMIVGSTNRATRKKADSIKVPDTTILSPEAAAKSLEEQDLVFGTCSQLELADSPTLLRETQIALQQSEKESTLHHLSRSNRSLESEYPFSTVTCFATPRNLWSVAARDSEGLLVEAEVVELFDTPKVCRELRKDANLGDTISVHAKVPKATADPPSNGHTQNTDQSKRHETIPPAITPLDHEMPTSIVKSVDPSTKGTSKAISELSFPDYNAYTDTQLATEVTSYGLKAIKGRAKIIEKLEKCWVAKHKLSVRGKTEDLHANDATASVPKPTASKPQRVEKKSRNSRASSTTTDGKKSDTAKSLEGQKEKTYTELSNRQELKETIQHSKPSQRRSFIDVEEIQDSEDDELFPSPRKLSSLPRDRDTSLSPKKQELPTSTIPSSPSQFLTHENREQTPKSTVLKSANGRNRQTETNSELVENFPDLAGQITKAVRAQQRQNSRTTWHEKILMYDPIYLEDFTAWLNTEGLSLVHEDREIGAGFVRQWCEGKGICCCYRVKTAAGF
ncbi:hypothetical protein BJX99DRAFT_232145 [Aspergillus californicus]